MLGYLTLSALTPSLMHHMSFSIDLYVWASINVYPAQHVMIQSL
jgi:hypothetical protein